MRDATGTTTPGECLTADEALAVCGHPASRSQVGEVATEKGRKLVEARAHMDRCEGCRQLVAEAARALVDLGGGRSGSLLTLSEGEQVAGRYRIVRFLARGGMGEVYEAFDEVLQETVALKTLLATTLDDDAAVARLAVEVRLARRVTHPNVCRILEFGFHAPAAWKGVRLPFLTMELLIGESLSRRIERVGALPLAEAMALARQMVDGLAAIHAAGIVHRDWKSDNAFLCRSAAGLERLVITDFGLANTLAAGQLLSHRTGSGIAGTVDYIAPEQLQGAPVTPAADIYALGVVLFEMVTGKRPFSGRSALETALNRLRVRPPAPSSVIRGLPPVWDVAVLRCLERQPERRFARVEEVLAALHGARAKGRPPRLPGWLVIGLPAATLVVAIAALVTWSPPGGTPAGPLPARSATASAPVDETLPPTVPVVDRPALIGSRWPMREVPVCLQAAQVAHDPEARVFEVFAVLDWAVNRLADVWFKNVGSCPPHPRGMITLTLDEGHHHLADTGYRADGPVRVHLGVEPSSFPHRVVHAFGRALGLGLRGDRVLAPDEIMVIRNTYGHKAPGSLSGPWGRCLARTSGKPAATLGRCLGGVDQSWRLDGDRLRLGALSDATSCLALRDRKPKQPLLIEACARDRRQARQQAISLQGMTWRVVGDRCAFPVTAQAGSEIGVGPCDGRPMQRWDFFDDGDRIRLSGTDLCVTAPGDAVALGLGTHLELARCGRGNGRQRFHFQAGGFIRIDPNIDLCLTMSMRDADTGQLALGSWCGQSPRNNGQVFSIAGAIRAGGGCLTVPGTPDDHAPVWVWPCVGGWNEQKWEYWW